MDEKQLIEQAGKGNEEAFSQLVLQYEKQIYNLTLRMTGDRDTAFDLTQETFLKAWRAISLFQFDSKFSTWLCRIASNTCIDFLRKQKKRQTISLTAVDEDNEAYEIAVSDSSLDPARIAEAAQDREIVFQALQSLPADYRIALSLRAIEDMSYDQIAEALNLSPGTVKSRISRARERIRKLLAGNFSESSSSNKLKGGMDS